MWTWNESWKAQANWFSEEHNKLIWSNDMRVDDDQYNKGMKWSAQLTCGQSMRFDDYLIEIAYPAILLSNIAEM
jgi:hypothetical protein